MKHYFKNPRYRICFQTRNKVWIYKNSRLRNFYKIRHKIVLKTGKFAKQFLITKNMKWTVARRQMVPYFRTRNRFIFFYKNMFFTKQQLKNFYGGLKEYQIRNIFKNTWNKEQLFRKNIFIGALEQRLGMVLFRMKVLPTIYTCNQLIKHHGIFVNNKKISLANFRVELGDIVSIPQTQWFMFYKHIFERLYHRVFGGGLFFWRKEYILKRLQNYRSKKKHIYMVNLRLFKKFQIQKKRCSLLKKYFFNWYKKLKNSLGLKEAFLKLNSLKILNFFLQIRIFPILKKIKKNLHFLKKWARKDYYSKVRIILFSIQHLKKIISNFLLIIHRVFISWILHDIAQLFVYKTEVKNKTFSEVIKVFLDGIALRKFFLDKKDAYSKIKIRKFVERRLRKTFLFKSEFFRYKRYFSYLLRKLKFRKKKKKTFKNFYRKDHWYTPQYLEIDYMTLRASFLYYPESSEVCYGFLCSFSKIISFYKERAL